MNKYDVELCKLISSEKIGEGIFSFIIKAPAISQSAVSGQFVHVRLPNRVLRRPISICDIDRDNEIIRLVFQIRGEGTKEMAEIAEGSILDILGPLGTCFTLDTNKTALFIGGGIGVPPLLFAAKQYGKKATAVLGFRNGSNVILEKEFKDYGINTVITTDDGSYGKKGIVTNVIPEEKYDVIYTCGPAPMIKSVVGYAKQNNIDCYISLEERMACGVGACLGCACELIDNNGNKYNGHVCKDGPVFDYKKVSEYRG